MIITRYIVREVLNALLAVTIVLLLAFLSQQVVRYLNYVAVGKVAGNLLFLLISFEIPYLIALLLPLGLYLGLLFAFNKLNTHNEMMIMQLYGYGHLRIVRITARIAIGVAGIVLILMMWINPLVSLKRQQLLSSDQATTHLVQTMMPGRFQVSPDGRYVVYVETLSRDRKRAHNIFLAENRTDKEVLEPGSPPNWTIVQAQDGYQMRDKQTQADYFVSTNGYRYEGTPGQRDYKIIAFEKYAMHIPQQALPVTHRDLETLSLMQLWHHLPSSSHSKASYTAELQWRISIAIMPIVLAFVAVAFSEFQPRQARYLTFLPAILVYIVYINLLYIARHWVVDDIVSATIGMWWVHIFMLLGLAVVNYTKKLVSTLSVSN